MSGLAVAVFAAEGGEHVIEAPRSRRFDALPPHVRRGRLPSPSRRRRALVGRSRRGAVSGAAPLDPRSAARSVRTSVEPPDLGDRPTVAIVGARACSAYGSTVAHALARDLAAAGAVVVSGLARGVDAAAHRGALETGRRSPSSAAGSTATIRARTRRSLPRSPSRGAIVSEYAPGVEPAPWRFPARNRIVAGLADATVVVEARERSGALITADLALDEGREVLAVPGEITSRPVDAARIISCGSGRRRSPASATFWRSSASARRPPRRARCSTSVWSEFACWSPTRPLLSTRSCSARTSTQARGGGPGRARAARIDRPG